MGQPKEITITGGGQVWSQCTTMKFGKSEEDKHSMYDYLIATSDGPSRAYWMGEYNKYKKKLESEKIDQSLQEVAITIE